MSRLVKSDPKRTLIRIEEIDKAQLGNAVCQSHGQHLLLSQPFSFSRSMIATKSSGVIIGAN